MLSAIVRPSTALFTFIDLFLQALVLKVGRYVRQGW